MRWTKLIFVIFAWIAISGTLCAGSDPDAVAVGGAVDKPGDWTTARVKSELGADITSISYMSHGQKHTSDAVPLISLLDAAGVSAQLKMNPNADPKVKNGELRLVVVVEGRDGYAV